MRRLKIFLSRHTSNISRLYLNLLAPNVAVDRLGHPVEKQNLLWLLGIYISENPLGFDSSEHSGGIFVFALNGQSLRIRIDGYVKFFLLPNAHHYGNKGMSNNNMLLLLIPLLRQ